MAVARANEIDCKETANARFAEQESKFERLVIESLKHKEVSFP